MASKASTGRCGLLLAFQIDQPARARVPHPVGNRDVLSGAAGHDKSLHALCLGPYRTLKPEVVQHLRDDM
jgi:hypothetical protein